MPLIPPIVWAAAKHRKIVPYRQSRKRDPIQASSSLPSNTVLNDRIMAGLIGRFAQRSKVVVNSVQQNHLAPIGMLANSFWQVQQNLSFMDAVFFMIRLRI